MHILCTSIIGLNVSCLYIVASGFCLAALHVVQMLIIFVLPNFWQPIFIWTQLINNHKPLSSN